MAVRSRGCLISSFLFISALLVRCQPSGQAERLRLTTEAFPLGTGNEPKMTKDGQGTEIQSITVDHEGRFVQLAYKRTATPPTTSPSVVPGEDGMRDWEWLAGKEFSFGRLWEAQSSFGAMPIRRFSTAERECAYFRKRLETTDDDLPILHRTIDGYICERRGRSLADVTVTELIQGIGIIRGKAVSIERAAKASRRRARTEIRPLELTWDGVPGPMSGTIEIRGNQKAGTITADWPGGRHRCEGAYAFTVRQRGGWSISCTNGKTASGEYRYVDGGKVERTGTDQDGKTVRFTLGQVS